ncbi:MAG TPA: glycosyltransferase family 4 protein [Chitinophagaceae bacterium]|nr:glycosyltransferase family 4 protein [Chitinophagaceae bacterium]
MQKHKKILFLTLKVFSATGGIEKVCKVAGKALYDLHPGNVTIFSVYDKQADVDTKYFPTSIFTGFTAKKFKAFYYSIREGIKNNVVILSHINLLPIGFFIKIISPKTKLVLLAHGIEVWQPLSDLKSKMLQKLDLIVAVSNYTKNKMKSLYGAIKTEVLNNCLDPFLPETVNAEQTLPLYKKYNLSTKNFILITVTRIASDEKYKGHEKVLEAIAGMITEFPNIRYLIVGKYDHSEKARLDSLLDKYDLKEKIIFAGFVQDEYLAGHYKLADLFIMPSSGEGFGIAFIEAMYYGLPVIAGNKDGSTDALCNGELGLLVDPLNTNEIIAGIKKVITSKTPFIPDNHLLLQNFSYPVYKRNLHKLLMNLTYN